MLARQIRYCRILGDLLRLRPSSFSSPESLLFRMARYLPLVTPAARDPVYRALHPHSAPSEKAFLGWNAGKQRAAEWSRAKLITRILETCPHQPLPPAVASLTTRRVAEMLRDHGFSFPHLGGKKNRHLITF